MSNKLTCALKLESRREARKALLAFSSDDAKPQLTDSERTENHSEGSFDQPINDDFQSSRSTPVRFFGPVFPVTRSFAPEFFFFFFEKFLWIYGCA